MARPSEEISRSNAQGSQKTDANLANDSLHLGGIPAEEYATKAFVQWYHDTKELLLKEYIDSQDLAKLQEAKAYIDTAIRNQDFSNFAKLQDLQALSNSLTALINECATTCQNRLNAKVGEVVADVNANFADVNSAITQLNNLYTQLFTSVSNGKKKVAAAITDKGVNTANNASFDTMASNIRNINTSGGEIDPNFVNTSDANATANDIMLGKTAYVKGQKVYGVHEDLDTSDATASADDILDGKSAYVNGQKIYGTHEDLDTSDGNATANDIAQGKIAYVKGQRITGTHQDLNTSDATAYSSDLRQGKTAYARGQKIVGTLVPEAGGGGEFIQKIYGTSSSNLTEFTLNFGTNKSRFIHYVYSTADHVPKFVVVINNTDQVLEIYDIVGNATSLKKSISYATLGIVDEYGTTATSIRDMYISKLNQSYSYMIIAVTNWSTRHTCINILPYEWDDDTDDITFEEAYCSSDLITRFVGNLKFAMNDDGSMFMVYVRAGTIMANEADLYLFEVFKYSKYVMQIDKIEAIPHHRNADYGCLQHVNDKLFYLTGIYYQSSNGNNIEGLLITIDENLKLHYIKVMGIMGISKDGKYMVQKNGSQISCLEISLNYNTGTYTQISSNVLASNISSSTFQGLIAYGNVLLLEGVNSYYLGAYYIDFVNNTLTLHKQFNSSSVEHGYILSQDNTFITGSSCHYIVGTDDLDTVIGVRYNGETYYKKGY